MKKHYSILIKKLQKFHKHNALMHNYNLKFSEDAILDEIEKFIKTFEIAPCSIETAADKLCKIFVKHDIPFAILSDDLEIIKDTLISTVEPKRVEEINNYFAELKNSIAFKFLIMAAKRHEPIISGSYKEKILYKIHAEWQENLRNAIIENDMSKFPIYDSISCPFIAALNYPESKMVCNELNICEYLRSTHTKLHELAATFAYLLTQKHYKSAYILYNEIREYSERLMNLIGVLYFNAQLDRTKTFKRYIHKAIPTQKQSYIAVFDIYSMKHINTFYNPKVGDMVIEMVDQSLKQVYSDNQEFMVYTRGVGGDYYLFFEDFLLEDVKTVIDEFNKDLQNRIQNCPSLPVFSVKQGVIEITPPFTLENDEIRTIFIYLKEKLKNSESPLFLTSESAQKDMLHWINNHYKHITYLKKMLDNGNIEIFLQPISRIHNPDNIHAFEVLARIKENDKYIPAGAFIDLLIDMKLIGRLDHLILDKIIHYKDLISIFATKLFINVSADTLLEKDYVKKLIDAIRGPLIGTEIIVELTEQVLLENLGLIVKLHKEHGLIFAIDDFGTGYSSLQTVIKLAEDGIIQYLKFDGSLTRTMEHSESTRRIIHIASKMSHSLGLESIIECVETEKQRRELEEFGIEYAQGYFIGRPQSVEAWHLNRKEKGYI
ncbi:EAL domain-containing protein [Hydrogenimonas thermophila]|uniref:EAL domain, c-di-GMP-specific phosphodiesterase class I (Or its enzymatically inactive variant) n=1 Tax=Hydrogenimonas thermophila TaxID=223786 RepID=A0A1I5MCD8_9BACT|nr:EAL domain-containing protein [Hydrogenimonas thermophila]WOE70645.1 EAL domain-containing protein [Hydrogenimonas thermophila]WOE73163.1 EAL domain-containing protein [Hydrogenimonas thermophila]SFP07169.1 EAL domain, c-di-GMP-specific phosphodiesterase class I (or its enzymatically inactive variant) [Hydrogenimonas thermophila]